MYEITVQGDLFDEEIERLMNCLKLVEPESKEYALMLKATKALEGMKVEEAKVQSEHARLYLEEAKLKMDEKFKELEADMREKHHEENLNEQSTEAENRRRSDTIKLCVEIAGIILPLVFCWTWMCRGLAFEETHVFISSTFRSLFSRFMGLLG